MVKTLYLPGKGTPSVEVLGWREDYKRLARGYIAHVRRLLRIEIPERSLLKRELAFEDLPHQGYQCQQHWPREKIRQVKLKIRLLFFPSNPYTSCPDSRVVKSIMRRGRARSGKIDHTLSPWSIDHTSFSMGSKPHTLLHGQ